MRGVLLGDLIKKMVSQPRFPREGVLIKWVLRDGSVVQDIEIYRPTYAPAFEENPEVLYRYSNRPRGSELRWPNYWTNTQRVLRVLYIPSLTGGSLTIEVKEYGENWDDD